MSQKKIKKARRVLSQAAAQIERMNSINVGDGPVEGWESFVNYWVKSRRFALQAAHDAENAEVADILQRSREDPILEYIFHARNADEHSEELIVGTKPAAVIDMGPGYPRITVDENTHNIGILGPNEPVGSAIKIEKGLNITSAGGRDLHKVTRFEALKLKPVQDRGVVYRVPTDSFGRDLAAQEIADYACKWLNSKIQRIES